jgi:hypothetical protein
VAVTRIRQVQPTALGPEWPSRAERDESSAGWPTSGAPAATAARCPGRADGFGVPWPSRRADRARRADRFGINGRLRLQLIQARRADGSVSVAVAVPRSSPTSRPDRCPVAVVAPRRSLTRPVDPPRAGAVEPPVPACRGATHRGLVTGGAGRTPPAAGRTREPGTSSSSMPPGPRLPPPTPTPPAAALGQPTAGAPPARRAALPPLRCPRRHRPVRPPRRRWQAVARRPALVPRPVRAGPISPMRCPRSATSLHRVGAGAAPAQSRERPGPSWDGHQRPAPGRSAPGRSAQGRSARDPSAQAPWAPALASPPLGSGSRVRR